MTIPTVTAHRYVTPLREGGSLPAIVDTDGGMVVTKFRGAGQGARALIAELIVGGLAQQLELPLPPLVIVDAPDGFGRSEPDPEIQDILKASVGTNVGLRYVESAFPYDPVAVADLIDPELAANIVWLDALVTNIDRTARNTNLLITAGEKGPVLWLIDHGAALYFHHNWDGVTKEKAGAPFAAIRDHVLLPIASSILEADERLNRQLDIEVIRGILEAVPDELLMHAPEGRSPAFDSADTTRQRYVDWFSARLNAPRAWAGAADVARTELATSDTSPLPYRR
ncbi:MAG: aminotransferase class I and II [Rubricoccaceae bacterium]